MDSFASEPAQPPGPRARRKADTLNRIREATRELVSRQGFDATTIRQIADRAGVGLATLFEHASDKRDLLFLACNDDLAALTPQAFDDAESDQPFAAQLTTAFRHFFIFYAQDRTLARDLLRELTFFTGGRHSDRFQQIRQGLVARIGALVESAIARGELRPSQPPVVVADVLFFIFAAEVRRWLAAETDGPERGVQQLSRLFDVVIAGLQAPLPLLDSDGPAMVTDA